MDAATIDGAIPKIITGVIEYREETQSGNAASDHPDNSIQVISIAKEAGMTSQAFPDHIYAQLLEGTVVVAIDGNHTALEFGQGIAIPVGEGNYIQPKGSFKMLVSILLKEQ